jgi:hypothetical protein
MMNNVLSGLTGSRCYVFFDDIVLYAIVLYCSLSLVDHERKLRDVFKRLRNITSNYNPPNVNFLGET